MAKPKNIPMLKQSTIKQHEVKKPNITVGDFTITFKEHISEVEQNAIAFIDWFDHKMISRQVNRLKDSEPHKWFYNHLPNKPEGKQRWEKLTTSELYLIFEKEVNQ